MSQQELAPTAPELWEHEEIALPVLTCSHRSALDQVGRVFAGTRPLAMLFGEEATGSSYLIDCFLAEVGGDVAVVRITTPGADEVSWMQEVIRGIGFESKGLNLADLENVFAMFLAFQKTHRRRTILCIEEAQDCGEWVGDRIRKFVDLETEGEFGLMILVSGRPSLNALLDESFLGAAGTQGVERIAIAPFTLAETREFIKRRIQSTGSAEISQVIEFHAITLIHELSNGVADAVNNLCSKSLELANQEGTAPVTKDLVRTADRLLRPSPIRQGSDADIKLMNFNGVWLQQARLIVRSNKEVVQEHALDRGHVLIGRGELCDIRVHSPPVSRHHALVITSSDGVAIVDLESTNGTFVDGQRIRQHALQESCVIEIGDCTIEFVVGDNRAAWGYDSVRADNIEPSNASYTTQTLETCDRDEGRAPEGYTIKGNINRHGEKIYHVQGTRSYAATKIDESKGERWFRSVEEAVAAGWRASHRS